MSKELANFGTLITPQGEPIPGRTDQAKNNAGGFVFTVDHWTRLDRFLVLGSEAGTYYVNPRKHTVDNVNAVIDCLRDDGKRTVDRIVEISITGRAPKNDQAIFGLAMALNDKDVGVRRYAAEAVPRVCRIGTHIFQLATYLKNSGGMGVVKRRAIASWYLDMPVEKLAYQMVKYRQRDGWTHHDLMHICHVKTDDPVRNALFNYAKQMQHGKAPVVNG